MTLFAKVSRRISLAMTRKLTDCMLGHFRSKFPGIIPSAASVLQLLTVCSYSDRVKNDAAFVRTHPLVRKELAENIFGAVYDIQTGKLTMVEV
jgi:hypothetical protein